MIPSSPTTSSKRVKFGYDYLGRRVDKQVFPWSGEAWQSVPSTHLRWVVFGWLPILELKVTHAANGDETGTAISRKYTWGLDLLQTVGGAGGIGGLLAGLDTLDTPTSSDDRTFAYFYDGNGNVTQLVETTGGTAGANFGTLAARYEYDPYGRPLLDAANAGVSGNYAAKNTFRFSTKPIDPETSFSYFGYRYYSATMGRWVSREPFFDQLLWNTYWFANGQPVGYIDILGLWAKNVHFDRTKQWAEASAYPAAAAEAIATADNEVDNLTPGLIGPVPVFGDPSYHFNRNAVGMTDSRLDHFDDHYKKAVAACDKRTGSDKPEEAAKELGTGFHPLQDYVAHGDYFINKSILEKHNESSPQKPLPGKPDLTEYPDDIDLDAMFSSDGRPAGLALMHRDVSYGIVTREADYAMYELGTKRIDLTEKNTKKELKKFLQDIRSNAGCKCSSYFGLSNGSK